MTLPRDTTEEHAAARPTPATTRRRLMLIVAVAVAFLLVVALGVTWVLRSSTQEPAPRTSNSGLPFTIPPAAAASKMVFAHYFPPYPLSLDNLPPASDYYARNYLSPDGENGAYAAVGGLLRDRPIGVSPRSGDWRTKNLITEVNQAADAGIDGFTVDILTLSGPNWDTAERLMKAATRAHRKFSVVPNLDVTASAGAATPHQIAAKLATLYRSPSAYRLPDGRYLLSSFKAEDKPVAWWSLLMAVLRSDYGIRTAFVAVLLDSSEANMRAFAPVSYALSNWGERSPEAVRSAPDLAKKAHALGVKWMAPVAVQDVRPRSETYAEADNTGTLRAAWSKAISTSADMVQMVTWNDYSEATSFAPSIAHGRAFLDISAYFLVWFQTGHPPSITRDSMYVTHRIQFAGATPAIGTALMKPNLSCCDAPRNKVEVLTMLTAPATVRVQIGGKTYTASVTSGLSAVSFPLSTGTVSATVLRDGAVALNVVSPHRVVADPRVQDLQYYAVSSREGH